MLSIPGELARDALEAAPDAMIIIDGSGIVRYANRQSLHCSATDTMKSSAECRGLMPERFAAGMSDIGKAHTSNVRVRPTGRRLIFSAAAEWRRISDRNQLKSIQDAERVLVAAAIRDVTDRKRWRRTGYSARDGRSRKSSQEPISRDGQP